MLKTTFIGFRYTFLLLLGFALLVSCETDPTNPLDPTDDGPNNVLEATTLISESYGEDPLQTYDAYLPEGRTTASTKALILVHGGFWFAGDKADWKDRIDQIQEIMPETAIFNINYRLKGSENGDVYPLTQQREDLALFLNHLKEKHQEFEVQNQVALFGFSAGAHLSLLHAYTRTDDESIKVVGDMSGLTNLMDPEYSAGDDGFLWLLFTITQGITGVPFEGNAQFYQDLSPLYQITERAQPTLILHGDSDPVCPISQPNSLKEKLDAFNVPSQMKVYEGEAHGWELDENWEDTFILMHQFMEAHW